MCIRDSCYTKKFIFFCNYHWNYHYIWGDGEKGAFYKRFKCQKWFSIPVSSPRNTFIVYFFYHFFWLRLKLIQNIMIVKILIKRKCGRMVELVDALDSKSNGSNTLRVRVSLRPPKNEIIRNK